MKQFWSTRKNKFLSTAGIVVCNMINRQKSFYTKIVYDLLSKKHFTIYQSWGWEFYKNRWQVSGLWWQSDFLWTRRTYQYWHFRLYCTKTKKSDDKMVPTMGIEHRPLITFDSKSNTLLSGLPWHLLVRLRLWASYIVMLYWFPLDHQSLKIKWCMNRSLRISLLAHVPIAQLDLESEVMGSIPTGGNILSLEFFCFHAVNTKIPIFVEKTEYM